MMKRILLFTFLVSGLFFFGCKEKQYLVGYYSWDEFQQEAKWEKFVDEKYRTRGKYADSLDRVLGREPVNVQLYVGTYCPDSKRWVPRFYKLRPELPVAQVEIISVDTTKKDEKGRAQSNQVKKIPTFIFSDQEGNELGRIVEKPKGRLEKNLYLILKNE